MSINRSKAISIYKTEAKRFSEEDEHKDTLNLNTKQEVINDIIPQKPPEPTDSSAPPAETPAEPKEDLSAQYIQSTCQSIMLFQLKRMIRLNTKAFAVIIKILIHGDPKRK